MPTPDPSGAPVVLETGVPDETSAAAVAALAERVGIEDGAPPLSDQARVRLRSPDVAHLIARDTDGALAGYAQRDGETVELVALPAAIPDLLAALDPPHTLWTHGRRSRLVPELDSRGYRRVRELHQLRRPASLPLPPDPALPDGVHVRSFVPGQDEDAWLALNAAAFAHHREQGSLTRADLEARKAEDWFDPSGFLLAATAGGQLRGFHWTKTHPDGAGEVYVLGIAPAAQGTGLGGALLVRGLRLLAERGCPYVLLYVDGDNPAALRLYERDGFERYDLDLQWAAPRA